MTPEALIAQKIAEQEEWLDQLISDSVRAFEGGHTWDEVLDYRERLRIWRARKLDQLEGKLGAVAG